MRIRKLKSYGQKMNSYFGIPIGIAVAIACVWGIKRYYSHILLLDEDVVLEIILWATLALVIGLLAWLSFT